MADTRIGMGRAAPGGKMRSRMIVGLAIFLGLLGLVIAGLAARPSLGVAALGLALAGGAVWFYVVFSQRTTHRLRGWLSELARTDPRPSFVTDPTGTVIAASDSAEVDWGVGPGRPAAGLLTANVEASAELVQRLMDRALTVGTADAPLSLTRGDGRLTAQRFGKAAILWRVDGPASTSSGPTPSALDLSALDGLPGALPCLHLDGDGRIIWRNKVLDALVDPQAEHVSDIFADREASTDGAAGCPDIGQVSHRRMVTRSGPVDMLVASRRLDEGGIALHFVAERGPAEPAPDPGTKLFDRLPVPILQIDPDGCIGAANLLARGLLGPAAKVGARLSDLFEGPGRPIADWLDDAFDASVNPPPEVVRAIHSANELFVQITLGRIGQGEDARLIAVLNDATKLKTLEAQFVQSQKMQAIGQLAGGVAHDFNNLLTAISGHCDLLLLRHDENDPDFSDLEQIKQNGNRAASLVKQLLAFSRKQNLNPELLDMRDTLADLTHLLNRLLGERVTLSVKHGTALQMVRADKRQLEQVIMNLVVNARDAMKQGGVVEVRTEMAHLSAPLFRDRVEVPAGDYVIVRVLDEGDGIPPERLPKIFEPFFTTKRTGEGTGLGLSTAYGIVKQTGGYIFADSVLGEGAEFSLYFPAHRPPAEVVAEAPAIDRPDPRRGDGVILLVEDEAPVRAFASRALKMGGYSVIEAEDAEAALERLDDPDLHVDIFVTDVIMPGMDGPTWVKKALEARPGTKVIFMSGYAEESFAEHQASIANSVFLPKPFSLRDLTATVHAQIG